MRSAVCEHRIGTGIRLIRTLGKRDSTPKPDIQITQTIDLQILHQLYQSLRIWLFRNPESHCRGAMNTTGIASSSSYLLQEGNLYGLWFL